MPEDRRDARTAAASVAVCLLVVAVVAVGFSIGPDGAGDAQADSNRIAVTNVAGSTSVTVTYTGANGTEAVTVDGVDPDLSGDGWVVVDRASMPPPLAAADGNASAGVVGVGEWALVGRLTAATATVDGTELRVVAPASEDTVDPARKLHFLRAFLGPYSLAPATTEPVTLVAMPSALPSDGRMYADDRGYVAQRAFWDGDVGSVWIHEFVHARQTFTLAPGMTWFGEASAEYLSYRVMAEQYEAVSDADLRERLRAQRTDDVVLADRSTWAGTNAHYREGTRVLYAVDAAVRRGSDGEHSLVDVFRALNRQESSVTVERFVATVERFSGGEVPWLETAITSHGSAQQRVEAVDGSVFETRTTPAYSPMVSPATDS